MTKIEQLLVELCPNGVEQKTLGAICQIVRGASPRPIKSYITSKENGVPWIKIGDVSTGAKYVTSTEEYITEEGAQKSRKVYKGDFILSNSMSFGRPYILQIDGCIHDGWLSISGFQELLSPDFLYHILSSSLIQREMAKKASFGGAVQNLNADIVRGIAIPVPPLPVQEEIVRILDELTEKTDELISELKAELEARKKQYEHYKNKLMSVDSANIFKLGDIAFICDGTHQTPHYTDSGVKFISVENINDIFNTTKYISKVDYDKYKVKPQIGDVFMTRIGSIGKCAVLDKQEDLAYYVTLALIRPNQNIVISKYLKYVIESMVGAKELRKRTLLNAVPIKINKDDIGKIELPIPSTNSQEKIVAQIEKYDIEFDMLIRSISNEIENRKKQYEYYRDKLLTF
ncbi:MAG: restriction endonuclease subunit S [Acutalibacteraceae bacterium]|nr:restriction endonuclease subunit S [Acutalibacteraceae bacterium]